MLNIDLASASVNTAPYAERLAQAHTWLQEATGRGSDFVGWVNLPRDYDKEEFARIQAAAERIRKDSQALVVIGIGGSYLGARAVIELLGSPNYNLKQKNTPDILFAGNGLSTDALLETISLIGDRDFSVNVISKSGTTTEPAVAFRIFKQMLEEKYGKEGARERIYATTDKARGALKGLADQEGYVEFVVPDEVGGRYSVLTAVGLLPIAVAGVDLEKLMAGAADMMETCRKADLASNPAWQYAAARQALGRAGVKPEQVDELMFGCILTAALGQNPARQVGVKAGLPYSVPAYTVGMVCGSGMKSVIEGARAILAGDADVIVAGGTENMSAAPFALPDERWGARMGDKKVVDTMIKDGLWDAYNNYHMGTTAENIADVWGITREEMDAFAVSSQNKTEAAQAAGKFVDEIVPVMVKKKKEMVEFKVDEYPKAGVSMESVSKLRGAFPVGPEGVEDEIVHTFEPTQVHEADTKKHVQRVTAANASGINDGAAAVVMMSAEKAKELGLKPMAVWVAGTSAGVEPSVMGLGAGVAAKKLMEKTGISVDDLTLIEANEAFASQSIASAKIAGWDHCMEKVNVNGGAIALGHPVGASGARILVTLLHELKKRGGGTGLATLCVGGGMGVSAIVRV